MRKHCKASPGSCVMDWYHFLKKKLTAVKFGKVSSLQSTWRKNRDVGSISNLGARRFEGTFSLRRKGDFAK